MLRHLMGLFCCLCHWKVHFKVSLPVIVYLAIDSRSSYIHGAEYEDTGDLLMLGGCHKRTKFPIYRSKKVHGPGLVTINFKSSRMTGIFLRGNAFQVRPYAELKVTFPGTPREISMVREGEKFSTNRACYTMEDIPPKYYELTHLRGPNARDDNHLWREHPSDCVRCYWFSLASQHHFTFDIHCNRREDCTWWVSCAHRLSYIPAEVPDWGNCYRPIERFPDADGYGQTTHLIDWQKPGSAWQASLIASCINTET